MLNIQKPVNGIYSLSMLLVIIFLTTPVIALPNQNDKCTDAENTLHTYIGSLLLHENRSGGSAKKRLAIAQNRVVELTKDAVASNKVDKKTSLKHFEASLFFKEPKFFSAYRSREHNPCLGMEKRLKDAITMVKKGIRRQCLNTSYPNKEIKITHNQRWNSQDFAEHGLFMDSQCHPKLNYVELYFMHRLTDGLNADVEKLCQAAWAGIMEVWNKAEICHYGNPGWFDIKEWAKGNIVKREPPKIEIADPL